MTIAIRKIDLSRNLFTEKDETVIDKIEELLLKKNTKREKETKEQLIENNKLVEKYGRKYTDDIEEFDLEKIKKEQNYQGYNPEEFEKHAKKLNITESLEELLAMLD